MQHRQSQIKVASSFFFRSTTSVSPSARWATKNSPQTLTPPQGREFRCQGAADSVFRLFCGLDRFDYLLIVAFDLHFLPNLDYLLVGAD